MNSQQERQAVFWCTLLHDLLFEEHSPHERGALMRELAGRSVKFPDGKLRKPSLSSLYRKLRLYQSSGFDSLKRKVRADRGKLRKDRTPLAERAIELKKDLPTRSPRMINQFLQEEFGMTLPKSTLNRVLHAAGATRKRLKACSKDVRKRWGRSNTHDLWIGDYSQGPYVLVDEKRTASTKLSAFIDIHSRFLVDARYYYNEKLDTLCDSLVRAMAVHGAPKQIYVDNAKVYHSDALEAFCLRQKIKKLHRAPLKPEGGGAIERIIQTIQMQFETEVRAGEILDLDTLNQSLSAWINLSYHQEIHSATKQSPAQRREQGIVLIRNVNIQDAIDSFYRSYWRRVHADYSDIQIEHVYYRVDQELRTLKVEARLPVMGRDDQIQIYDKNGCYLGTGKRHAREDREVVAPVISNQSNFNALELLRKKHRAKQEKEAKEVQLSSPEKKACLSSTSLLSLLSRYMGRSGLSDFTTAEVEAATQFVGLSQVNAPLVKRAIKDSSEPCAIAVLLKLNQIIAEGK